ncbi:MAG TPA: hypothetical protein VMV03_10030 [Spirochaetia bacterium]|nr:hypothetical protein [Spirochaetia bacterium]
MEADSGKSGVQELVQGLAAGLGMDLVTLLFKWEQEQEPGTLHLRVYLGKRSERLVFSGELVRSSAENAYPFVIRYSEYILETLRKLKQAQP